MRKWLVKLLGLQREAESMIVDAMKVLEESKQSEIFFLRTELGLERRRNEDLQNIILKHQGVIHDDREVPKNPVELNSRLSWPRIKRQFEKEHAIPQESLETEKRWLDAGKDAKINAETNSLS